MNNHHLLGFRVIAEARLCRENPETQNAPPPAVEIGENPSVLPPSAADSPGATQKAVEKAAAERGGKKPKGSPDTSETSLDKQIADVRKQVGDLTTDVMNLRRDVQKQERLRPGSSPGEAVPVTTDSADQPLSQEQFEALQVKLKEKETALQHAQEGLQTLKESRPEPKNMGEKAKRVLSDTGDIMNDPNKSMGEKLVAGFQALGAILALWRDAIGGVKDNLQKGADTVASKDKSGKEQPDGNKQEHRAKLRADLKKSGKNAEALATDKSQQAHGIFNKPDPKITEAINNKNTLMGERPKLQAEYDVAKGQATSRDALQGMESGLQKLDQEIIEAQKTIDEQTKARQDAADTLLADAKELKDMKKEADTRCKEAQDKIYEMTNLADNQRFPALHATLYSIAFSVDTELNPQCKINAVGQRCLKDLGDQYTVPLEISYDPNGLVKGDLLDVVAKMNNIALAVRTAEAEHKRLAREKKA